MHSPTHSGQGIKLTPEYLKMKTRQELNQITQLNLWGSDLQDISIIQSLVNIEILALTVNRISTLKDL